jgi:hypothetical protein
LVTSAFEVSTNQTPLKVGESGKNYGTPYECRYTEINLVDGKESKILYKEDNTKKPVPVINTGVIVGSEKKKFTIKVDEKSSVKRCALHEKSKHTKQLLALWYTTQLL